MANLTKATKITVVSASLLTLALGALILSCQPTVETQAEVSPTEASPPPSEVETEVACPVPKEVETMDLPETYVVPDVSIPPIDASAPTETETATFALG